MQEVNKKVATFKFSFQRSNFGRNSFKKTSYWAKALGDPFLKRNHQKYTFFAYRAICELDEIIFQSKFIKMYWNPLQETSFHDSTFLLECKFQNLKVISENKSWRSKALNHRVRHQSWMCSGHHRSSSLPVPQSRGSYIVRSRFVASLFELPPSSWIRMPFAVCTAAPVEKHQTNISFWWNEQWLWRWRWCFQSAVWYQERRK